MLQKKDPKAVSTVHLYKRQVQQIEALAKDTGQSRAQVLREVIDLGLKALDQDAVVVEASKSKAEQKEFALKRLLAMGSGYGKGAGRGMAHLDEELYQL